jgi:hypothetical protein
MRNYALALADWHLLLLGKLTDYEADDQLRPHTP